MNPKFISGSKIQQQQIRNAQHAGMNKPATDSGFRDILQSKLNKKPELTLSAHAKQRLEKRNIKIGINDLKAVNRALERAKLNGNGDSLVCMGDMALIVNVKNKKVVTALKGMDMNEKVFTNIDSAIFVNPDDT